MKDIKIQCAGCAACCQEIIPPITHLDVQRIINYTGLEARSFCRMYTPDEIDLEETSKNWVIMKAGKRVLGLLQPKGKCRFLSQKNKCTIYKARPMVCRGYPFSVVLDKNNRIKKIDSHKSTSNSSSCEAVACITTRGHIIKDTLREDAEDRIYWKKCDEWNKGKRVRDFNSYLAFMGLLDNTKSKVPKKTRSKKQKSKR